MIGKKKKLSKKEFQEDQLVTSFYKSQDFFQKNQQKLLIGAGVIALLILAIFWYNSKKEDDSIQAANQLAKIIPVYDQGQFQKAIDGEAGTDLVGLASIVDNYGSTQQGEIAKIYLANSYFSLGKFEKALSTYSDYGGKSKLHLSSSLAGQAACYEQLGKFDKAADYYQKAAKVNAIESQEAEYLLNAGRNYVKSNSADKAKDIFETIKNDFKNTNAAREVDKYLSQL
ncbi:MAG: tetratricopeptide repeat protein [Ignavibacteriales bacterium]|nr:tetratricopeptide repeat protein [Ignavibacteriales bacterium]